MCTLYSLTKGQAAMRELFKVTNDVAGNLAPQPGIRPDNFAPVITQDETGRTLTTMRWGMPSPAFALKNRRTDTGVMNVRNTKSPH